MTIAAALDNGQACGFITTTVMPASLMLGTAWSIRDIYVVPQRRRAGIARTLIQHVINEARSAGAYRVSLQTEAGNTAALMLYTAAGFQRVSDLETLNLTLTPGSHHNSSHASQHILTVRRASPANRHGRQDRRSRADDMRDATRRDHPRRNRA
jgi:N-acetylglutamate synthase-like GNAT family acetyltransferase